MKFHKLIVCLVLVCLLVIGPIGTAAAAGLNNVANPPAYGVVNNLPRLPVDKMPIRICTILWT